MRKLILLLITLTIITNVSFASFPIPSVVDTPFTDTILNIETTEQYHKKMQNQGFDISSCRCPSCRKVISLSKKTGTEK